MMGLFSRIKADGVVLIHFDGERTLKNVEWICDVPYAAPYLPHTRCKLLPDGTAIGHGYIKGWEPATEGMRRYFRPAPPKEDTVTREEFNLLRARLEEFESNPPHPVLTVDGVDFQLCHYLNTLIAKLGLRDTATKVTEGSLVFDKVKK